MEIDLFTFIIQIINFVILLFLLNRFLFSRVRKIMEERNGKIIKMVEEAKTTLKNAEMINYENLRNRESFEEEKSKEREQLCKELEFLRIKKESELNEEIRALREKECALLNKEFGEIREEFIKKWGNMSADIAGKIIKEIAGVELEVRIFDIFFKRLDDYKIKSQESAEDNIIIKSSFEIIDENKEKIKGKIDTITGKKLQYEFLENKESPLPYISVVIFKERLEIGFEKYLIEIKNAIAELKEVK